MRTRRVIPPIGVFRDFRTVIDVHADDPEHTLGTRADVLHAAKVAGVKAVLLTDHQGPKPDAWKGVHDGVLFIPGSEEDHTLRFPALGGDLRFLSEIDGPADARNAAYQGMAIYNRRSDYDRDTAFQTYLTKALGDSKEWNRLTAKAEQYPDELFGAGTGSLTSFLDAWDRETQIRAFTGIAANESHQNQVYQKTTMDPYSVAFRNLSTHVLAMELRADSIRQSLRDGHVYVAHDWLCDPEGFFFVASNDFGTYNMGDSVPLLENTRLLAGLPAPAKIRLLHGGKVIQETTGEDFNFVVREPGAYRLEAWLTLDGEDRPWIYSNPIYLAKPDPDKLLIPQAGPAPSVAVHKDVSYTSGKPEDENKHKLDLYLPKDKLKFPVLVFIHGGSWQVGDRSFYQLLGTRFAKLGIAVVIPSYRLAPANPPPAQVDDVAAAVAWVFHNIGQYGGDVERIYVGGHAAGGHLASLVGLDPRHLEVHHLDPALIRGVISLSGVYDVRGIPLFGSAEERVAESPLLHMNRQASKFLLTYCEWDYPGLPNQARAFDRALRKSFVGSDLIFIPKENHVSEIIDIWREDNATVGAILNFLK